MPINKKNGQGIDRFFYFNNLTNSGIKTDITLRSLRQISSHLTILLSVRKVNDKANHEPNG